MALMQQITQYSKAMIPFLRPMWPYGISFSITGYLVWKLPITGKKHLHCRVFITKTMLNRRHYNPDR